MRIQKHHARWASVLATVALLVAAVVLVAAGGGRSHSARATGHLYASQAKQYTSLAQLTQDATSVAVIQSTGAAKTETDGGIPWTITTMRVIRLVAGSALPSTLDLRQAGDGTTVGYPVVSTGNLYLAYVQPFELQPGVQASTGQFVAIGGLQGLFEQSGTRVPGDSTSAFAPVTPGSDSLPANVSIADATAAAATQTTSAPRARRASANKRRRSSAIRGGAHRST